MNHKDKLRNVLEDSMELSEQTLANIRQSEQDIKAGRVKTLAQVEKELKKRS